MTPDASRRDVQSGSERASLGGDVASQALNEALRVSFRLLKLAMILVVILFLGSGIFMVREHEKAFKLRFGALVTDREGNAELGPGLHFAWPFLIDEVVRYPVTRDLDFICDAFAYKEQAKTPGQGGPETLAPGRVGYNLTGDANILHTTWKLTYVIDDPVRLCRRLADPSEIGRTGPDAPIAMLLDTQVRRAVLRTIGRYHVDQILGGEQDALKSEAKSKLTAQLKELDVGIKVNTLVLSGVVPPRQTKQAFDDVTKATQDRDRLVQDAKGYEEKTLTEAEGDAAKIKNDAEAYAIDIVNRAKADADYLSDIRAKAGNDPLKLSIFLQERLTEVVEEVLEGADEIYLADAGTGKGRREVWLKLNRSPQAVRDAAKRRREEQQRKREQGAERPPETGP